MSSTLSSFLLFDQNLVEITSLLSLSSWSSSSVVSFSLSFGWYFSSGWESSVGRSWESSFPSSAGRECGIPSRGGYSLLRGQGCSLHLQNQDRELKFRSWVYQRPVTMSKSRSTCPTPVRNLQCPPKLQSRLKGHKCSWHLENQDRKLGCI